ncbi:MAG TPA: T9SS type A sorting domain-containing protein [Ignavibacteria bacterium]|nr:T9SS type A sorting domain-containing protein [Ignavibacteria bacterium]
MTKLVNEELSAGTYEVEFNSNNLSSGIYFYRMETENYIETKKMIILK